jgi:hypothetical protein
MSIVERQKYVCYCVVRDGIYMYNINSMELKHYFNFKEFTYPGFVNDIQGVITFTNELLIIYTSKIFYINIDLKNDKLLKVIKVININGSYSRIYPLFEKEFSTLFVPNKVFYYDYITKFHGKNDDYSKLILYLENKKNELTKNEIDKIKLVYSKIDFNFTRISKYEFGESLIINQNGDIIAVSLSYDVQILRNNIPIWTDHRIANSNKNADVINEYGSKYKQIRSVMLLDAPNINYDDYRYIVSKLKTIIPISGICKLVIDYL